MKRVNILHDICANDCCCHSSDDIFLNLNLIKHYLKRKGIMIPATVNNEAIIAMALIRAQTSIFCLKALWLSHTAILVPNAEIVSLSTTQPKPDNLCPSRQSFWLT